MDTVAKRNNVDTSSYIDSLYADYALNNGHYGLPLARSITLFYYNKDLWKKAGLPDRGPESWQEFSTWAPRIKEALGSGFAHGWASSTNYLSLTFEGPMWSLGGNYSSGWDSRLTSPETIKAVEWLKSTIDESWATVSTDVTNEFATGLIGSCIQSTGDLAAIVKAANFELGTAPLPNPTGAGACPTGGAGLSIPAKISEQRQNNAIKFIDFITTTANTTYWSRETGYVPVRKNSQNDPEHAQFLTANPNYQTAVDQLPQTRVQDNFRFLVPNGNRTIGDELEKVCLTGADVQQSLKSAEDQLLTIYNRDIKPNLK